MSMRRAVSQNMHFYSAAVLNPVTKELLEQMKIFTMAVGSWLFFRRGLTARKVAALVLLVIGVVMCVLSNVEGDRTEVPTLRGFCQVLSTSPAQRPDRPGSCAGPLYMLCVDPGLPLDRVAIEGRQRGAHRSSKLLPVLFWDRV